MTPEYSQENLKPIRRVFRGLEVLDQTRQITTEMSKTDPKFGKEILKNIGNSIGNFVELMRAGQGTDYYLSIVVDVEGNFHFLKSERRYAFWAERDKNFHIIEDADEEIEFNNELKGESVEKILENFALIKDGNNYILIGAAKNYTDSDLNRIAGEFGKIEEKVTTEMGVTARKKVCFFYEEEFIAREPLGFAMPEISYAEFGTELGMFLEDGSFNPHAREQISWVYTRFYQGIFEDLFTSQDFKDSNWLYLEKLIDDIKSPRTGLLKREMTHDDEDLILKEIEKFLASGEGFEESSTDEIFADIIFHKLDLSKVPDFASYKEAFDWNEIYSRSLTTMVSILASGNEEGFNQKVKYNLKNYPQFTNLDHLYNLVVARTITYSANSTARHFMEDFFLPSFLIHIRNKFGITTKDIAKAASSMNRHRYICEQFCKELNLDYREVSKSWIEELRNESA